jgi:uncharacterized membrane protein
MYLTKVLPDGSFAFRDKPIMDPGEPTPVQYDIIDEFSQYMDIDSNGYLHTIGYKGYRNLDADGNLVQGTTPVDLNTFWTDYAWGTVVGPDDITYILDAVPSSYIAFSSVSPNGSFIIRHSMVNTPLHYQKVRFAIDGSSNIYAVAFSQSSSGLYDFLKIDSKRQVLKTTRLATGVGYTTQVPDIAYSPDGMVHIVWSSGTNLKDVRYMRLDTEGNIDAGPFTINTGSDTNSGYPRVAADPGGNAYVVWPDGAGSILLSRINKGQSASPGWSEAVVSGVAGASLPEISIGNNGDVHIVYIGGKFANQRAFYIHGPFHKDYGAYFTTSEKAKASKVFVGDKVSVNLTISNNGTLNDTYKLKTLTSTQTGWSASFPTREVFVPANTTLQFPLTIKAPASAVDHEAFWSQVQVLSTNYTEMSKTTEKLTSEAAVDHKIVLGLPTAEINGTFGVPLIVNFSLNNVGHAKEFLNLSAQAPSNWSVDIGKGPGAFRKMTMELGTTVNISMTVVPGPQADAGLSPVIIKVIYDLNGTIATSGKVQVRLPIIRSLTMVAEHTNLTAKSYSPAVFLMTISNGDNTGSSYKIKMDYYCDFSTDIINVTFSQNDFIVQARAKALVFVNITPRMVGTQGQIINVTIYASTEQALLLQASQNLSLTMGRSLLVLHSPDAYKETEPGKTAAFDFSIMNVGDFEESISCSILTLPAGWNSSMTVSGQNAPPTILLPAGATISGVVYVTLALGKTYVGQNVSFHLYAKYGYIIWGLDLTVHVIDLTTNNSAPVFTSVPANKAISGKQYLYQIKATDKDTDLITYSLMSGPANMSIDATGLVNWTPTESQIGTHKVVLRISDGKAPVDQTYTIEVISSKYSHGLKCNIVSPSDGDVLKGPARISGTATFPDVGGFV